VYTSCLQTFELCSKAVNFVPFSDPYTIGQVPMLKAQEDEDLLAAFVYICFLLLLLLLAAFVNTFVYTITSCFLLLLLLLVKSHIAVKSVTG